MKNIKVYITEDKLSLLKESQEEEVTFYSFFSNVKDFIKELLADPVNAKPNEFLKRRGFSKSELVKKLIDRDIIIRKEDIKEVPTGMDENGGKEAKYIVQYKVPKKNFEKKIHRLYSKLFESSMDNNINLMLNNPLNMGISSGHKSLDKLTNILSKNINTKSPLFTNEKEMADAILDMDDTYKTRGGIAKEYIEDEEDVVTEEGEGGAAFAGATNANISAAAMFDVPMGGVQRKKFYGDTLKRNKDEKNGSMSMNRVGDK